MPSFRYRAVVRTTGKEIVGQIEAQSAPAAIAQLKSIGHVPISITEHSAENSTPKPRAKPLTHGGFGRVKAAHLTQFTRQLAILQDAGLPVVQSLQILTDMEKPGRLKRTLTAVTNEVQGGAMLSEAMAHHPRVWDPLDTNLIKAGEMAGSLETILRRLAEFREKAARLKKKVITAMVYPSTVMFFACGILTFIMMFIVPKFESIFKELNIELPLPTVWLVTASRFIGSAEGLIALATIVGIITSAVVLRQRTRWGANLVDRLILRIPIFGNIARKSAVARFSRTLSTLISSGVGFLDALTIVQSATPNHVVRQAIGAVRSAVKEGEPIYRPLGQCGVFDDLVVNMVKVGEETGELDRMLAKVADTYEEEVDYAVAGMLAMLEPAMVVFMGFAVGFIVIALFLPLLKILGGENGGGVGNI